MAGRRGSGRGALALRVVSYGLLREWGLAAFARRDRGRRAMRANGLLRLGVPALLIGAASLWAPATILAQPGAAGPGGTGAAGAPPSPNPPESPGPPPSTPCTTPSLHLRCPDMIMSAPYNLHVDRSTIPGHVLLRAASSLNNRGSGPLEIRAKRIGSHAAMVYQAIYDRSGRRHVYRTAAKLVFKYVPGDRYEHESVGSFNYWKFEHAAAFELWSIDGKRRAVALVRAGPKVDYCLRDLIRSAPTRRSPSLPVYPACSQNAKAASDVLGTSVGWSDVYPYEYPEQWIDVTGLHGAFAYVQMADPDSLLMESDKRNNVSETYVSLPSGRVLGHRVGVSLP